MLTLTCASQHTSETEGDDEAEYGRLVVDGPVIIREHIERVVNTLQGRTRACDGTCTCTCVAA